MKRINFNTYQYYEEKARVLSNFSCYSEHEAYTKLRRDYYNVNRFTKSVYDFASTSQKQLHYVVARVIRYIQVSIKNIK